MLEFFLALAIFLAAHVIPARSGLRERLVASIGERAYLIGYSLLSIVLLAWLIHTAIRAPTILLWPTSVGQYHFALALMLPASMLLAGGALAPNPLSIGFRSRDYDPARPGIVGLTRHPILWGFALWAIAHVVPNGDLVSLILFGGFALFAFGGMAIVDRRRKRQLGPRWQELRPRRPTVTGLLAPMMEGIALYLLFLWLHPVVIGADPTAALL